MKLQVVSLSVFSSAFHDDSQNTKKNTKMLFKQISHWFINSLNILSLITLTWQYMRVKLLQKQVSMTKYCVFICNARKGPYKANQNQSNRAINKEQYQFKSISVSLNFSVLHTMHLRGHCQTISVGKWCYDDFLVLWTVWRCISYRYSSSV